MNKSVRFRMNHIYEQEHRILIDCLKNHRLRVGLTQQILASRLGCRQAYVSKYEQGQKRLDIIEVRNICACLNLSLSELIQEWEERITFLNL